MTTGRQKPGLSGRRDEPAQPIGIFDSGVGGLSVAKEIRELLPGEDLLYFADSRYCQYGEKPRTSSGNGPLPSPAFSLPAAAK